MTFPARASRLGLPGAHRGINGGIHETGFDIRTLTLPRRIRGAGPALSRKRERVNWLECFLSLSRFLSLSYSPSFSLSRSFSLLSNSLSLTLFSPSTPSSLRFS